MSEAARSPKLPADIKTLPSGFVLENYRVEKVLGGGRMSVVYLATDMKTGGAVAIKEHFPEHCSCREDDGRVLYSRHMDDYGYVDPDPKNDEAEFVYSRDRFIDKARTQAGLSHPGLVRVHRHFEANGTAYMVMGHVAGESMEDWLRGLRQPPAEAQLRAILMPLLDVLEHIHEAGLVHRGVTPDNICLTPGGTPVLLDFGCEPVVTARRQFLGDKDKYKAFELHQARPRLGPATDLYGLAASMARAILGRTPDHAFERFEDPSLVQAARATRQGQYGRAFLRAIDAAFAVNASKRPQSVAAWRRMLQEGGNAAASGRWAWLSLTGVIVLLLLSALLLYFLL